MSQEEVPFIPTTYLVCSGASTSSGNNTALTIERNVQGNNIDFVVSTADLSQALLLRNQLRESGKYPHAQVCKVETIIDEIIN